MTQIPSDLEAAVALSQSLQAAGPLSAADERLNKLLRAHLAAPLPDRQRWRYLQLRLKQFDKANLGPLTAAEEAEFAQLRAQAEGEVLQVMDTVLQKVASEPPTAPPWIWSRGWFDWALRCNPQISMSYFDALTETRAPANFMSGAFGNARGFVWLRCGSPDMDAHMGASDVATFVRVALPSVTAPFVLVTTDGDRCMPSQLPPGIADTLLNSPYLVRWYTQNWDGTCTHEKLCAVPIGLDLHTGAIPDEKMALLQYVQEHAAPWAARPMEVAIDALGNTHVERRHMLTVLDKVAHMRVSRERLPFTQAMQNYAACRFAVSPRGNGWDCHRTWELLYLGTVPIVRTSPLDGLYRGLPVVIVADWEEVRDPNNLGRWSAQVAPLMQTSGSEWLRRERWVPAPSAR